MEAELVRDNLLQVAGNLEERLGGADLDPELGLKSLRRSLYFRHAKEKRVMFLRLFDSPNVLSCYRRSDSVMPQQGWHLQTARSAWSRHGCWLRCWNVGLPANRASRTTPRL